MKIDRGKQIEEKQMDKNRQKKKTNKKDWQRLREIEREIDR